MNSPAPGQARAGVWLGLALSLLCWNCYAATFAGPFSLVQGYDGVQYQLLARNRLNGHTEVGDTGHTVRSEGRHPMWRPGLVWIMQGLACWLGEVRLAAALASALGTTLLELALLWLAWRCFGPGTCVVVFFCLVAPLTISVHFLRMAVGQGPEPWAAALILVGLAALGEALRRRSWRWALAAGLAAGLAEWFRSGNLILFAVPCAVYALAAWKPRDQLGLVLPALALVSFAAMAAGVALAVPSRVDKTAANVWANLVEHDGLQAVIDIHDVGPTTFYVGAMTLAPGTTEVYYDHIVRRCQEVTTQEVFIERAGDLIPLYFERLGEVLEYGAWGLRLYTGEILFAGFVFQVLWSLVRRGRGATDVLAFAGGALAFYLGPVVLLQGDAPTHYLLVGIPLIVLVSARGLVQVGELSWAALERYRPATAAWLRQSPVTLLGLVLPPVVCLCVSFYQGAITTLQEYQEEAQEEQHDLDALDLCGRKVACRNMSWFVDRDVQTVLLPYATVPELERFVRSQGLDGVLLWTNEKQYLFRTNPHGSLGRFGRALERSRLFGPVQVSGGWRWYPVRPVSCPEGRR